MGWSRRRPRKHSMPISTFLLVPWGGLLSGSRTAKGGLSKLVTAVHYKKSRKDRCFVFSPPFFQSSSLLFFNIDGSRASLEGLRYSRRYDAACIRSHTRTFLSSFCPPDRTKNTPEYSPISRIEVSVSRESFEGTSSISRGRRGRGRNAVVPEAFERFQFRNSALLSRTERERERNRRCDPAMIIRYPMWE